jgi:vancomycin permeability regulator SanA
VKKLLLLLIFFAVLAVSPWFLISWMTSGSVYRDVDTIPAREVGLLLGTTPSV